MDSNSTYNHDATVERMLLDLKKWTRRDENGSDHFIDTLSRQQYDDVAECIMQVLRHLYDTFDVMRSTYPMSFLSPTAINFWAREQVVGEEFFCKIKELMVFPKYVAAVILLGQCEVDGFRLVIASDDPLVLYFEYEHATGDIS